MEVRSNGISGSRLFDYEPKYNIVTIIKNKTVYRVKLYDECHGGNYKILDKYPRDNK